MTKQKRKTALSGARRRAAKAPKTVEELRAAFNAYSKAKARWRIGMDIEQATLRETPSGFEHYREKVLGSTITPAANGRCTFFVTKAESLGAGIPRWSQDRPYTVTSLCNGGRELTGAERFSTLKAAREAVKLRAGKRTARARSAR
jgi:hypothetical protein